MQPIWKLGEPSKSSSKKIGVQADGQRGLILIYIVEIQFKPNFYMLEYCFHP